MSRHFILLVLAGGILFGLAGWLLASAAPANWYARAVIQAGFVGQIQWQPQQTMGQVAAVTVGPVESPHAMLERVNSLEFRTEALRAAHLSDRADLVHSMKRRFSARVLPAAQLMEFRVRGATAEESHQLANALIVHLHAEHAKEVDPSRQAIERVLAERRVEEKALLRQVAELDPVTVAKPDSLQGGFGSNAAFASFYVNEAHARLPRIRQEIIALETALDSIGRRVTGPLGMNVDVIDDGWGRRRGVVFVVASILGAMFGGLVWSLSRRRLESRRE